MTTTTTKTSVRKSGIASAQVPLQTQGPNRLPVVAAVAATALLMSSGFVLWRAQTKRAARAAQAQAQAQMTEAPYERRPYPSRAEAELRAHIPAGALPPHMRPGAAASSERQPPLGDLEATRKAEVAEVLEALRKSGPATGSWTTNASATFFDWRSRSEMGAQVALSDFECFHDGCKVLATYKDEGSFRGASRDFQLSPEFTSWSGRKFRSGPISLPSGETQATWVLFN